MENTILLNADYTFLNVINWKKAITLVSKGKVEALKYHDKVVRSVDSTLKIPSILKLVKFIRKIYKSRVPFSKKNVFVRDGFKCAYCGDSNIFLTIDHVLPKKLGGKSTFENCVACCKPCNDKKGSKLCSEVKMYPKTKCEQPTISQFLSMKIKHLGIQNIIDDLFK